MNNSGFSDCLFLSRIISAVIYGAVWKWIYDPRRGLLPLILSALGHKGSVALLGNAKTVMLGVTITGGWTYFGFCMVILLAGFMSVDTSLRESALLDGANRFQIFVSVDIPQIRPVLNTLFVYTIIDSFKVYDLILVMTNGGPNEASQIMTYYIYKQAFVLQGKVGYAFSAAVILMLMIGVVTIAYFRILSKRVHYQ